MSLDQSLKTTGGLARHRNVLKRAERVARLQEAGRFDPQENSPLGLPKVISRKVEVGKKKSRDEEEE